MHISYVTYARMPTEKAHGLQISSMCEAFMDNGHEVLLVTPKLRNAVQEPVRTYYRLSHHLEHTLVPVWDIVGQVKKPKAYHHYINELLFALKCVFLKLPKNTIVYTRSSVLVPVFKARGFKVICEEHFWPSSGSLLHAALLKLADCVPCNSEGTFRACREHGVTRAFVAPNAIDEKLFTNPQTKNEARTRLSLDHAAKVIMYIGSLEGWKGVETLCGAAEFLDTETQIVVIGGREDQVRDLQKKYPRVKFLGQRPYHELPHNQQAADVLVVPNSPTSRESEVYTSPIKLFAHMVSGIPTLVSDLPSMRTIASEDMLWFFEAGNTLSLIEKIREILAHNNAQKNDRVEKAKAYAFTCTWKKRAETVLNTCLKL